MTTVPATLPVPQVTVVTACLYIDDATQKVDTLVSGTADLLNSDVYLVVFCDANTRPGLEHLRRGRETMTLFVDTQLRDLWTAPYFDTVSKNRETFWPTRVSRHQTWAHLLQCNKFAFVQHALQHNPFKTNVFAWVDNRLTKMVPAHTDPVPFLRRALLHLQHTTKAYVQVLGAVDSDLLHPSSMRQYYSTYRYVVCGGLLAVPLQQAHVLDALKTSFEAATRAGYGHGEEMLYPTVLAGMPDAFVHSYGDYQDILVNCPVPRQNLRYVYSMIICPARRFRQHQRVVDACDAVLSALLSRYDLDDVDDANRRALVLTLTQAKEESERALASA